MKKITSLMIAFSMFGSLYADDQQKEKREHPNKLMSAKECMETKDAIGWFLESADSIALSALASNYSNVYDVWCKDMINHRMKMRMHSYHKEHMKEKKQKKD